MTLAFPSRPFALAEAILKVLNELHADIVSQFQNISD